MISYNFRKISITITIFLFCFQAFSQKTSVKVLLDSVFVYLDSVPELRDSILLNNTITVNKDCQINLYNAEYKNLRIHLQYCLLPRYSKTERIQNTKNLISYFITEEIKQFNAKLYSKKETHKIFKILSDTSLYRSVHTKIYDSYWANSDKIIIFEGQVHNKSFVDEENKLVKIVQDDILNFSIYYIIMASI